MSPLTFAWFRVVALARKDAAELLRNPGAIVPPILMVAASLFPAFLVIAIVPALVGRTLSDSGEFVEQAANAAPRMRELANLSGEAMVQAFVLHQFALLLLLVPIVSATALATHAVVGEKQSRALEPLLATPISTLELLAAKALTPFVFALALTWSAVGLYVLGAFAFAEPGVWRAMLSVRIAIMFGVLGPLVELASLQVSVIVSSRAADARSAQQLSGLLILPITSVFVAQLMGVLLVGPAVLLLASLACLLLNVVLLWAGVRVFQRETILTRWR